MGKVCVYFVVVLFWEGPAGCLSDCILGMHNDFPEGLIQAPLERINGIPC